MINAVIIGITIGIFGYLVANVLSLQGEALSWLPSLVQRLTSTQNLRLDQYNAFQYWIAKVTYDCGKCIAGNLALWICFWKLSLSFFGYGIFIFSECYTIVVLAIFSSHVIEKYV